MSKVPLYVALRHSYESTSGKGYLRCLTDAEAHRWAQKMYASYISADDFSKFPSFLIKLDRLLTEFGAKKSKNGHDDLVDDDEIKMDKGKKRKKSRGKK
jgi:hypothetical protein